MNLLETWREWADKNAKGDSPYVLDADRESEVYKRLVRRGRIDGQTSQNENKPRLNLRLLPYPFIGAVKKAKVYVLMANANAGSEAWYSGNDDTVKKEHIANLKQDFSDLEHPFVSLKRNSTPETYFRNPKHHYWYGKLRLTIEQIKKAKNLSCREEAIDLVARNLAVIQLSPYWSTGFIGGANRLPSAQLAMNYVKNEVVPRVRDKEAVLVVVRRKRDWGGEDGFPQDLIKEKQIVIYDPRKEARAASLSPESPAGKVILKHLQSKA